MFIQFDPKQGIEWTAKTLSLAMRQIVSSREDLFEVQRKYGQADLADDSAKSLSQTIAYQLAVDDKVLKSQIIRYTDFCDVLKIPAYPITSTMIALFLFAKCSTQNGQYSSTVLLLKKVERATNDAWNAVVDLDSERFVRHKNMADRAIAEFQAERAEIRVRAPAGSRERGLVTLAGKKSRKSKRLASRTSDAKSPIEGDLIPDPDEPQSGLDLSANEDVNDCQQPTASTSAGGAARGHRNIGGHSVEQLPTPNLPQPGDRFSDFDELLSATYRALLPVYGMGARYMGSGTPPLYCAAIGRVYSGSGWSTGICRWKLGFTVDPRTNEHVVDAATSNFYHNHGPHPKLLKDPAFLPIIRNERTAPSTPTAISTSSQSHSTPATSNESPSHPHPNKKPRLASPAASPEDWDRTKYSAIPSHPRSTSSPPTQVDLPHLPSRSTPLERSIGLVNAVAQSNHPDAGSRFPARRCPPLRPRQPDSLVARLISSPKLGHIEFRVPDRFNPSPVPLPPKLCSATLSIDLTGASSVMLLHFDPKRGVEWTAETHSSAMLEIVSSRNELFKVQRQYGQDDSAENLSRTIIAQLTADDSVLKSQMIRYTDFCDVLKIPAFPITSTMIALFLFAKCSHQNGHYSSTVQYLKRAASATSDAWDAVVDLDSEQYVRDQNMADRAIEEFQAERAKIRVRGCAGGKRKRPAGGKSGKSKRFDSDSSDSDSPVEGDLIPDPDEPQSGLDLSANEDVNDCQQPTASTSAGGAARGHRNIGGHSVEQLPTPNLPQPGDRFSDFDELLSATYRALLPVYGLGARYIGVGTSPLHCGRIGRVYRGWGTGVCRWKLGFTVDPRTNEHVVDAATSNFYHNHGPQPKLLQDPSYRPIIRNERVRRDLGMPSLRPRAADSGVPSRSTSTAASTSSRSDSTTATSNESPSHPNKKPRLASPPAASFEASNRTEYFAIPSHPRSTSSPRTRVDLPHPPSISTPVAPASSFSSPTVSLSSTSDPRHDHLETQQHGLSTVSVPSTPLVSLASTSWSPESFESLLVAFFASFDLALAPLAKRFVDGGWITSRDELVAFCAFDHETRSTVVEAVVDKFGAGSDAGLDGAAMLKAIDKLEESLVWSRGSGWTT
ncbi:hypothetical protein JCM10212_003623 [Sporobolomyces blumeae]